MPQGAGPARIAVLSAFPAELAAVLERTRVEDTVEVAGRTVRIGTLGGTPVVVAMTGIGLVNAATTTRAILEQLPDPRRRRVRRRRQLARHRRRRRRDDAGRCPTAASYAVRRARICGSPSRLADARNVRFEHCTSVPNGRPIRCACPEPPVFVVGGEGASEDPFGGAAFPCHGRRRRHLRL